MSLLNKSNIIAILLVLACGFLSAQDTPTKFQIHSLFQSNMILQRSKPVDVWGWSKPGDKVTVKFAEKSITSTADKDGKWKTTLPAMEANSTPAVMSITGSGTTIKLENILIGDVWILGGQSNMQWPISRADNGKLEVASANFPKIRLLEIPKIFGTEMKQNFPNAAEFSKISGKETSEGDWQVCSPETVGNMSAIGYIMGRRLHLTAGVPIGLINTSRGGTTVEAWTPINRMRKLETPEAKARLAEYDDKVKLYSDKEELDKRIKAYEDKVAQYKKEGKSTRSLRKPSKPKSDPSANHRPPGNCYSSVISPIAGLSVKGTIFHQGYNNCFGGVQGARMYRTVFPEMIKGWRQAFNDPEMPFAILSQCTAGTQQSLDNFLPMITDIGARIREAQYQTFLEFFNAGDKNIGFVSTYDLRRQSYHPGLKIPAGERAAAWALSSQYGMEKQFTWQAPMLKEMKMEDGALVLTFDQSVGGLSDGAALKGFAIAGEDMKFQPAEVSHKIIGKQGRKVKYDNKTLVLKSFLIDKPVHFRYAWARNPMGNIRRSNRFGNEIPLPTQRSDKWSNADLLKAYTGKEASDLGKLSKGDNNSLRAELTKEDQRRKLEAAKALLKAEKELSSK